MVCESQKIVVLLSFNTGPDKCSVSFSFVITSFLQGHNAGVPVFLAKMMNPYYSFRKYCCLPIMGFLADISNIFTAKE